MKRTLSVLGAGALLAGFLALPARAQTVELTPGAAQVAGAEVQRIAELVTFVAWADAMNTVVGYAAWVVEQEAAQAEAERQARARAAVVVRPAPSVVVSGACGGATNGADRFIARESGGNPNIWNTGGSGAWGCYQIMPGTWRSSCSDLGVHGSASPEAQAACASRLPLSAWGG